MPEDIPHRQDEQHSEYGNNYDIHGTHSTITAIR